MRLFRALTIVCLGASGLQGQVALNRLEVVASGVSTDNGGNSWGPHKLRIVRTNAGVFTAYGVGPGPNHEVRLAQRTESGWKTIMRGSVGPPHTHLLARRDGSLIVIGWAPAEAPVVYTSNPQTGSSGALKIRWPDTWARGSREAAVIGPGDDLYILASYWQKPSGFYIAHWKAADGKWSFRNIRTGLHHAYAFLFPEADGPEWVADRDVHWEELGWKMPPPPGDFGAVFDGMRLWRWKGPKEGTLLREEPQTEDYLNVKCDQTDVYRDQLGRLHILYTLMGKTTTGQMTSRHMVLRADGTQEKDVALPGWGMWRTIQDASGAFYFIFPDRHSDSLKVYGPSQDSLELGSPKVISLNGNHVDYQVFLATPRAGVPVADVVDGVFLSTDAKWVYFRLRLR